MTPLRQKLIEEMQLRGLAERTQEAYVSHAEQLAAYVGKSPAEVSEAELRRYFLYLHNEKQAAPATCQQAQSALKFLYYQVLGRSLPILEMYRAPREERLPVVMSRQEVKRVWGGVRQPYYRVRLKTIYGCGLRLKEGVALKVGQIDSERMVVWVRKGKGGKDRQVLLPEAILTMLRSYWAQHRHREWLFPGRGGIAARGPMSESGAQKAFRLAVKASGGNKAATVHTLRHSYGRPFGRLVNASSDAIRHQRRVFLPWRFSVPSRLSWSASREQERVVRG